MINRKNKGKLCCRAMAIAAALIIGASTPLYALAADRETVECADAPGPGLVVSEDAGSDTPAEGSDTGSTEAAAEDSAAQDSAAQDSATQDSAAQDPATEDPATQDPAEEEPAGEDPAAEEPAKETVKTGLYKENGKYYYAKKDGSLVKNKMVIVGKNWYYMGKKGAAVTDQKVSYKGSFYYANSKGRIQKKSGWIKSKKTGNRYYAGKGGKLYCDKLLKTGTDKKVWYYFNKKCQVKKGQILKIGDDYYYATKKTGKFRTQKGLVETDAGNLYYVSEDAGKLVQNQLVKSKSDWYYFGKNAKAYRGKVFLWEDNYYYAQKSDGKVKQTKGWVKVGKKKYYVTEGGSLYKNTWKQIGKKWYHFNKKAVRDKVSEKAPLDAMGLKAQGYSSNTDYLILVNRSAHRVCIYKGSQDSWEPIKSFLCGNGKASTPTITGSFNIPSKYPRSHPYFDSGSARCWYPTRIHGGYLFHSVLYYQSGSPSRVMDGRVGIGVSHGCVRLQLANAKWIYDNIPVGTKVVIY